MNITLKGKRIILRKLKKSDADTITHHLKDHDISRYTSIPYPYNLDHAFEFIKKTQRGFRSGKQFTFGIALKGSKQVLGIMSLERVDIVAKKAEVGYWLSKKYWKQGIADECLKLILDFGFNKLDLIRVWARILPPNISSKKLLEKNGFKYEGTLRKNIFKDDVWYDELRYAILRKEYNSR